MMNRISIQNNDHIECNFKILNDNVINLFQIKGKNIEETIIVRISEKNIELLYKDKIKKLYNFKSVKEHYHKIKIIFKENIYMEIDNNFKYDLKSIKLNYEELFFYVSSNENVIINGVAKNE